MLHNVDIVDCLIFLESKGITDEQIMERMGCNRSTISRWWEKQKATPRYLAKMQKWRLELLPIDLQFIGKRPPEHMFIPALEAAVEANERGASQMAHRMRYKGFYDNGIPSTTSRAIAMKHAWKSLEYQRPPETDYVRDIIARFHPDERVREAFKTDEQV